MDKDRPKNNHHIDGYGIPDFVAALEMLDIEEVTVENEIFSVFPNPSNGNVKVTFKEGVDGSEMTVYDNIGRMIVNTMNVNELEAVLNNLGSGVYTVSVISEFGSQTLKLVVAK